MKLSEYIKDKINYILALATYIIIISTYLKAINLAYSTIFIVIFITCTYFIVAFLISYYKTSKYLKNIEKEKVNEALKDLTSTQFRRIDLHIVNEITIRDVAKLEKVQKSQIQKSLELGLKKIKKFFEE